MGTINVLGRTPAEIAKLLRAARELGIPGVRLLWPTLIATFLFHRDYIVIVNSEGHSVRDDERIPDTWRFAAFFQSILDKMEG